MLQQLLMENPWWGTGFVPALLNPPIKRHKYDTLVKGLQDSRITALIGPRRVGKSTLLYQLIDHLIREAGIPPKRILFLSMENPLVRFDEALDVYLTEILNETLNDLKAKIYLFVDEIHFWPEWNRRLKRFVDLKLPVKIVVSGSSATHLARGSAETLAGRITEEYIYPFDFGEFVRFSDLPLYETFAFLGTMDLFSSGIEELLRQRSQIAVARDKLLTVFQAFRKKGGFIPYIHLEFPEYHKLLRSDIIEKTIYKDLSVSYNIRSPLALEKILVHLCLHSGELLNNQNISQEFGISLPSVERYIKFLELAHFASTARNILPSGKPALRSYLKAHIADLSMKRVMARGLEDEGPEVETVIFNNIYRRAVEKGWQVYYWRHQKDEVDIIVKTDTGMVPVEVKFRKGISHAELKGLFKFMEVFGVDTGYVISREVLKVEHLNGKKIIYIPAYLVW